MSGDDAIVGDSGADALFGDDGGDTLDGGGSDDHLRGGVEADAFLFYGVWGDDVIYDFEDGSDVIGLLDMNWQDLDSDAADGDGDGQRDDVVLFNNDSSITILNMTVAQVDEEDFAY